MYKECRRVSEVQKSVLSSSDYCTAWERKEVEGKTLSADKWHTITVNDEMAMVGKHDDKDDQIDDHD